MREILVLFVHLIATVIRLASPGGLRAVVAESVLVRHQLLILNRGRKRAPNLHVFDRIIAGLCTLLMRPAPRCPLCHCSEAVYFAAFPSRPHQAKVPAAVFPKAPKSARSERTQPRTHRRRR